MAFNKWNLKLKVKIIRYQILYLICQVYGQCYQIIENVSVEISDWFCNKCLWRHWSQFFPSTFWQSKYHHLYLFMSLPLFLFLSFALIYKYSGCFLHLAVFHLYVFNVSAICVSERSIGLRAIFVEKKCFLFCPVCVCLF